MTVKVTWLGHACVQLEYEDKLVLIDPWISNPKFPGEDYKPKKIDILCITHGHNDHFGEAIELARKFNPRVPVMHEMSVYLSQQGVETVVGMNFGGTYEHKGIKITMVPSSHSSGYSTNNEMLYLGSAGGYVIEFPDGNIFYHCGDTGVTAEMKITRNLFKPKIGLLAIGGHFTMDPKGAAYAAKKMELNRVLPIHWGTFIPPLVGTPEDLQMELKDTKIMVDAWKPGDCIEIPSPA